ncbi:hypothetical protein LPB86_12450 [Pedobacter sp. MC2016-14]|uniref:DUF6580 family putative transport protein n=1 Tax=Pedobacter sp. MC2016-14 TaxID=2897327 RepID=UPI001E5F4FC0|nr:DUF6580 family putative transport protein [Pedobacter sp. MC2016-14]MCD0489042.1 hypothetical protein [Pedobacter sp. MC2016-14]
MSKLEYNPRNIVLLVMILAITLFRLLVTFNTDIFSFANFSSLGAVALFGGAYFKDNLKAFAFPILSLFLSDFVLANTLYKQYSSGFLYSGWYWVYIAFALMVLAGKLITRNKVNVINVGVAAIVSIFIHWIVTDLGVWYNNPQYAQDLSGYMLCLVAAVPFELKFLGGTVVYAGILFGGFELLKSKYPVLQVTSTRIA